MKEQKTGTAMGSPTARRERALPALPARQRPAAGAVQAGRAARRPAARPCTASWRSPPFASLCARKGKLAGTRTGKSARRGA